MTKPKRTYPSASLYSLPPDPRRKSRNLMVLGRLGPRGPLEVACCNGCGEKGRAKPDGSCRHTDALISQLKPWWRSRAIPRQPRDPAARPAAAAGEGQ